MAKRLPPRLLPHINAIKVERSTGGGADGRTYHNPDTPKRCQIVDGAALVNGKYDPESNATATIYMETKDLAGALTLESKVTLWLGDPYQRVAYVQSWTRYQDPQIGDYLEIRVK